MKESLGIVMGVILGKLGSIANLIFALTQRTIITFSLEIQILRSLRPIVTIGPFRTGKTSTTDTQLRCIGMM
jgi:hypothetical protein